MAQVVANSPFRARELIDRVCAGTREAFGFKDVEWRPPHALVPVADEGEPLPDQADLSVLTALRTDFVSIASHELRTPISVVHGIAATLHARAGDLEDEQVHALLGTLVQQTDRLSNLADQLLDLSRVESGGTSVRAEVFHPRRLLDELLPRIAGDRLGEVRVLVDADCEVVADAVAFERVAANLILNALSHGEPPVEVRSENGDGFRLVVEDRGEGVAPEFVPRLFERFSRSDDTRRAGAPGAGLGLSIASAYTATLGGRLGYEPAQPRGARFTLWLPAARS